MDLRLEVGSEDSGSGLGSWGLRFRVVGFWNLGLWGLGFRDAGFRV